jgi:hypothetical protein
MLRLFGPLPAVGWRREPKTRHRSRGVIRAGLPALSPRTPGIGRHCPHSGHSKAAYLRGRLRPIRRFRRREERNIGTGAASSKPSIVNCCRGILSERRIYGTNTMKEIERLIGQKRRELKKSLKPIIGEDTDNAVEMLLFALRREFGGSIEENDRPRFREALERLPRGSTTKPMLFVSRCDEKTDPHFKVVFVEDGVRFMSSKRFDTKDEADTYALDFLMRLRGEINREDVERH